MKHKYILVRILLLCPLLFNNFLSPSSNDHRVTPVYAAEVKTSAPIVSSLVSESAVKQIPSAENTVTATVSPSSLSTLQSFTSGERTFTRTFLASKDTYIDEENPTTNYGLDPTLWVRMTSSPDHRRTLLYFDVQGLPENAVVLTATLELYNMINRDLSQAPTAITVFPDSIDSDWSETGVTWNTRPSSTNRGDAAEEYVLTGWTRWNVTNIVAGWLGGDYPNYGILLRTGMQGSAYWLTREDTNGPRLTITYTTEGSPMMFPVQKDTWVNEALPSTNYGSEDYLRVRYDGVGMGNRAYTLLWFDTSDLPSDIVVISATLEAYSMINQVQSNQLLFGEDIFPDTIHTDWDEMTVTWNNKPVAYGGGPPSPYQEGWMSWDVTESVEGWVDGTALNYGIQLRIYNVAGALADFVGRPNPFAPRLTVYYEPAPPVCDPMTAVSVSGPTQGNTSTDYAFEASVTPFDATAPFTYTWAATDQTPVVAFTSSPTHTTTFNWASAGSKTVTVTVESCSGSVSDVHTVNITTPPPACTDPLTGMTFSGPPQGLTDAGYSFRSVVAPKTATTPITFTWEADEQSLVVVSGIALQSTQVYTWNTLGPKAITVTAENCGGTFVKYHTMEIVEPWELPDLDVSTAWYDSETQQIGYLVQNIGGSIAPAWHYINLYQGTVEPEQNMPFPHTLQPGAIREATFDTARACATASEPIRICADYFDKVVEGDEGNNCWSLTWPCDMDPPAIISGPTVVTTTENTATIAWETNEPCSSEVKYGKGSVYYPYSEETATLTTDHQVVLTGLDDTSVYHFYVLVTDAGGTSVNSDEAFFETQAAGFDPPIITHLDTVTLTHDFYDLYVIQVSVDDITGLDRIELYYGGDLIKTDYFYPGRGLNTWAYISPHAMGETRATFFFSGHMVTAKAINHNGATTEQSKLHTPSLTPKHVDVDMITPPQNHTLYVDGDPTPAGTTINVMVEAAQFEWGCTWSGYIEGFLSEVAPVFCADVDQAADEIKLLLDGVVVDSYTPAFGEFNHTFSLDLAGEALGTHTVEVVAHASDGNTDSEQRTFTIARGTPSLSLQRTVSRVANYFEVQLTLSNAANATLDAEVSRIFDYMHGFQVISKQTGQGLQAVTAGTYTIRPFSYFAGDFSIKIEFFDGGNDFITLAPGESFVVNYVVVPVMFESATNYTMGDTGTLVHHKDGPDTLYATSGNLNSAVASAFNEADYLIVTNPSQLVVHYGTGDDLNALYSEMARLAQLKRGALGYLNSTNKYVLDDLVEPNQPWAAAMYPDFSSIRKGYMLIVGEVEIVSAWSYTGLDLNWADSDVDDAHYSDHAYANTKGDGAPDLIVGRVIGDSPTALRDAIRTGINVDFGAWEFDRSHALLVSGRGGSVNRFRDNVNDLESDLTSEGWAVTKIHWRDYRFLSTYWHGFREYDGFAAGDVIAGGKAEVAIARRAGDYIHLKDADGNTVGGFDRSFDEGDVIAVGDVGWDSAAEVIIGDRSDGTIYIYDFDGGAALGSISCGFASFDGLATGYVKAGTKAQIIFGDASADTITVYDQTGASLMSFSAPFDTHDGLAAGNVMTGTNETTRDEILVGHDDTIYVYDDDDGGLVSSFSVDHNFIAGDRLAAGNIHAESGIAFDEIVIGDRDDVVYMYNKDGTLLNSVNVVEFEYYDGLAVADVTGGYEEEIIMADRDDYIHLVDAYYPHHALSTFKANTAGQDVIYFSGHGNTNVWGPALHTWDFPLNFNNTKPFVFAPSCLTGNYEGSNDNRRHDIYSNFKSWCMRRRYASFGQEITSS
ncbi:MAG: DNRLRE domain-containing protein [Chloroflexota bacterium]|nr:DNRLRE domain-containing protein [Chloroflexota bacterium]